MLAIDVGREILEKMVTNKGDRLTDLSREQPVMLVFLRHFGCTFCREALAELAEMRDDIEKNGTHLVFVHMSEDELAERYFTRYGLEGALHIGDPECKYYAAFGLVKGNLTQLFGLQTWIRGFSAGVIGGHGIGSQLGDGFQMPGVFVIRGGVLQEAFIHKHASDKPDYDALAKCCNI